MALDQSALWRLWVLCPSGLVGQLRRVRRLRSRHVGGHSFIRSMGHRTHSHFVRWYPPLPAAPRPESFDLRLPSEAGGPTSASGQVRRYGRLIGINRRKSFLSTSIRDVRRQLLCLARCPNPAATHRGDFQPESSHRSLRRRCHGSLSPGPLAPTFLTLKATWVTWQTRLRLDPHAITLRALETEIDPVFGLILGSWCSVHLEPERDVEWQRQFDMWHPDIFDENTIQK
jgi:hypothetical protein